jgi:hypothetical protein
METVRLFVLGIVFAGVATALFAPGRQTVAGTNAVFNGADKLLKTSETGN